MRFTLKWVSISKPQATDDKSVSVRPADPVPRERAAAAVPPFDFEAELATVMEEELEEMGLAREDDKDEDSLG